MALKARDKIHQGQINAGIKGRLLGHSFESSLSQRVNSSATSILKNLRTNVPHIVNGKPEYQVISYVAERLGLKNIRTIKSYWLGGLATSGKGDELLHHITKEKIKRSKSDILLEIETTTKKIHIGVSVKTCNKDKPTNAQLFCSTASAFCELLRRNSISITEAFERGLKMFCGDEGYRPLDSKGSISGRKSDPDRWFFEELPSKSRLDIENTIRTCQDQITRALLQNAYEGDPFPPDFVFHQTGKTSNIDNFPAAIFSVNELIGLSKKYAGFCTREYMVRKGRFKGDPNPHLAPRFGCIQFQRLGNKQNATQLQFNLEAGYFFKIISREE